jgi:hypothetical protein
MRRKFNVYGVDRIYAEKGVSGYLQIHIETPTRTYIFHILDTKLEPLLKQLTNLLGFLWDLKQSVKKHEWEEAMKIIEEMEKST